MNSRDIEFRIAVIAAGALALLFVAFPETDLWVAGLFHQNNWQWLLAQDNPLIRIPYHGLPHLGRALIATLLPLWLGSFIYRHPTLRSRRFLFGFLLAAALIGPILIVDAGLKNQVGRARPAQIETFGGSMAFTPAFMPSNQCERNCSFVSGHVATTAFVMAFGWLSSAGIRRRWLVASIAAAGFMGLVRMSAGGHFLSDCVFAWFATYFSLWLTEWIFLQMAWHRDAIRSWRRFPPLASWLQLPAARSGIQQPSR